MRVCLASKSEIKRQAVSEILSSNVTLECVETVTSNPQPIGIDEAIKCVQERHDYVKSQLNNELTRSDSYDFIIIIENYIEPLFLKIPEDRVMIAIYNVANNTTHLEYDNKGVQLPDLELYNNGLFVNEKTMLVNEGGFQISSNCTVKTRGVTYGELLCKSYPQYAPADNWMKHFGLDRKDMIKNILQLLIKHQRLNI